MDTRTLPGNAMAGDTAAVRPALVAVAAPAADPGLLRRWSLALLVRYARNVDWDEVLAASLRACRARSCWRRIGLARWPATSLYSCFDLIGRRYTGHDLATRKVMAGQLHQLRLQPEPGLAGRRRRLPLPAVLAAGPGQRRDHPHPVAEHADQLARLPAAGRLRCSSSHRCSCRRAGSWATTACTGWAPRCSPVAVAYLRGLLRLRASAAGRVRGHELFLPPLAHGRCCSWPCRAPTGC